MPPTQMFSHRRLYCSRNATNARRCPGDTAPMCACASIFGIFITWSTVMASPWAMAGAVAPGASATAAATAVSRTTALRIGARDGSCMGFLRMAADQAPARLRCRIARDFAREKCESSPREPAALWRIHEDGPDRRRGGMRDAGPGPGDELRRGEGAGVQAARVAGDERRRSGAHCDGLDETARRDFRAPRVADVRPGPGTPRGPLLRRRLRRQGGARRQGDSQAGVHHRPRPVVPSAALPARERDRTGAGFRRPGLQPQPERQRRPRHHARGSMGPEQGNERDCTAAGAGVLARLGRVALAAGHGSRSWLRPCDDVLRRHRTRHHRRGEAGHSRDLPEGRARRRRTRATGAPSRRGRGA